MTPRLGGGGVERATLDLAAAVVRAGGRSIVASLGGSLEPELAATGSTLARLPLDTKNPIALALNAARLTGLIRREKVSLVHVRSRAPAFSALWAGRATATPVVATYHGIYSGASPLKRWYNGVMTRGDQVIANSRFTRDHILSQHGTRSAPIALVPEGVDTRVFDPAAVTEARVARVRAAWRLETGNGRRIVLLAARLTDWKGQRLAIEALSRLENPRQVALILAGRPQSAAYAQALGDLARRLGVGDQVRLVGAVDDMPAAFKAADLVLAPSCLPESFGRGVVEAGAMRRVVIASALGAHLETVVPGETGWLVPPADAQALADAMEAALAAPRDMLDRMGLASRERAVRLHDLADMCDATLEIYRRMARARP